MKKSDLKKVLKPIVKECINEALLEQGLLSTIITEVVRGLQPLHTQPTQQNKVTAIQQQRLEEQRRELAEDRETLLREQRKKLLNATGLGSNIFEGVAPLAKGGNPESDSDSQAPALAGVDPNDAGVDIAGIMSLGGGHWKRMMGK